MRLEFAYENALNVTPHFLMPGSVVWEEDEKYPIFWTFSHGLETNILGWGTDLQRREEDGMLTAEVEITDPKMQDLWDYQFADPTQKKQRQEVSLTFEGNEVVSEVRDKIQVIHNVKLRAFSFVLVGQVSW